MIEKSKKVRPSGKTKSARYSFRSEVWKSKGKGGWFFVTLPKPLSTKIRKNHGLSEEGWGRLKTLAKAGNSTWRTAIWYDTQAGSYLLPLKAEVRKKEKLRIGSPVEVTLEFESYRSSAL